MNEVIIQGGGEHARVVLDCLLASGHKVLGLFDPKYSEELMGVPQRGAYNQGFEKQAKAVIAIGDNAIRKKVSLQTTHEFMNAIHPSVLFSPFASVGTGCMLLHGVIVQAQSVIGNHVILNTGARVDHDCVIEDFVHVAPGAILCGNARVSEGAMIGAGAVVIPGKKIGAWATVGAGAVVTADVPDYAVAVGNPAKTIRYNKT